MTEPELVHLTMEVWATNPAPGSLLWRVGVALREMVAERQDRADTLVAALRTMTAARDSLLEMPAEGLLVSSGRGNATR